MDLGQLSDEPPVVQALDHVELPQRPRAVQGPGDDPADGLGELLGVAGRRHGVVTHVEVDVELRVLDPVRQIEAERHLDQSSPEGQETVDAIEDDVLGGFQPGAAGRARRVVDRHRADVPEVRVGLEVQEADVDAVELSHNEPLTLYALACSIRGKIVGQPPASCNRASRSASDIGL